MAADGCPGRQLRGTRNGHIGRRSVGAIASPFHMAAAATMLLLLVLAPRPAAAGPIQSPFQLAQPTRADEGNGIPSKGIHLSHRGLYLTTPLAANAPPFLSLYVDATLYDVKNVSVRNVKHKERSWDQVHLECGALRRGGIEECERDDLSSAAAAMDRVPAECKPSATRPQESRVIFDMESCPALAFILQRDDDKDADVVADFLHSATVSIQIKKRWSSKDEQHTFWLARLHRASTASSPTGRALWPFAGTAHAGNDSTSQEWNGVIPNRIAGLMQDPYLPKASRPESSDPLLGVDMSFAEWAKGIAIGVPANPNDTTIERPLFEPVHSPVSGQVVWLGNYTISRAPGNHRNDEKSFAVMIRDDWGFVYQLLGLDRRAVYVKLGQDVNAGKVVGGASRTPLSLEPPCRHKPADPPKMDDDSRRYPYRRRMLRVMVARPDPNWTEWRGPTESGWQYFNPLDAFERGGRTSDIPPDPNPTQVFFAYPSEDGGLTPPNVFATSTDVFQPPVLTGNVEVIVGFDDFSATPGDEGDKMDPLGLHALDWAAVPETAPQGASTEGGRAHTMHSCGVVPENIVWRTAFEHSRLPNDWAVALPKTSLLAHYVPAFTTGRVPLFKRSYASAFDEKARKLYYAPTRTLGAAVFGADGSSTGGAPAASWDTRAEQQQHSNGTVTGDGLFRIWVRGRSWFGNAGCFSAVVRLSN